MTDVLYTEFTAAGNPRGGPWQAALYSLGITFASVVSSADVGFDPGAEAAG